LRWMHLLLLALPLGPKVVGQWLLVLRLVHLRWLHLPKRLRRGLRAQALGECPHWCGPRACSRARAHRAHGGLPWYTCRHTGGSSPVQAWGGGALLGVDGVAALQG